MLKKSFISINNSLDISEEIWNRLQEIRCLVIGTFCIKMYLELERMIDKGIVTDIEEVIVNGK